MSDSRNFLPPRPQQPDSPGDQHDSDSDHDEKQNTAEAWMPDGFGHLIQKQREAHKPRELLAQLMGWRT